MRAKIFIFNIVTVFIAISILLVSTTFAQSEATSTEALPQTEQQPEQNSIIPATAETQNTTSETDVVMELGTTTEETTIPDSTASTSAEVLPQEVIPAQPQPSLPGGSLNFTRVNIVGTKYVDYFTDGQNEYSFPSDPNIVAGFNQPNSPMPTHGDLKWTGTRGYPKYDTQSGDLEEGQYAQQSDGTYVVHYPPMTYTSATSTEQIFTSKIVTTQVDPSTQVLEGFSVVSNLP